MCDVQLDHVAVGYGRFATGIATNKWLDSDIGDRATMSKPSVRIESPLRATGVRVLARIDALLSAEYPRDREVLGPGYEEATGEECCDAC